MCEKMLLTWWCLRRWLADDAILFRGHGIVRGPNLFAVCLRCLVSHGRRARRCHGCLSCSAHDS